jgi:hypothetical protein
MRIRALLALSIFSLLACSPSPDYPVVPRDFAPRRDTFQSMPGPSMCVALRGRDEKIAEDDLLALARLLEHYGPVHGAAGGGSASVTIFLLESALQNPAIVSCGKTACGPTERGERAALLFKSMPAYLLRDSSIASMGDFYAAYKPVDVVAMQAFVDACTSRGKERGRGDDWETIAKLPVEGGTCGSLFTELLDTYLKVRSDTGGGRLQEMVGASLPALVSTSVFGGDTAKSWIKRKDFTPAFSDVRFGYFGPKGLLDSVEQNRHGFDDLKTQKFLNLGAATWEDALRHSEIDPTLAHAEELRSDLVAIGGWSDPQPTLILKNAGCDKVVYVAATSAEDEFSAKMLDVLNAQDQSPALFATDRDSAFTRSLAAADARYCIEKDPYNAVLETSDPYFTVEAETRVPYDHIEAAANLPGCTPLAAVGPHGSAKK